MPLFEALGQDCIVLYYDKDDSDQYVGGIQLVGEFDSPDGYLSRFCELIEKFSDEAKATWDDAQSRVFCVAIEAGTSNQHLDLSIDHSGLKRVVDLGAKITISVYPKMNDELSEIG